MGVWACVGGRHVGNNERPRESVGKLKVSSCRVALCALCTVESIKVDPLDQSWMFVGWSVDWLVALVVSVLTL